MGLVAAHPAALAAGRAARAGRAGAAGGAAHRPGTDSLAGGDGNDTYVADNGETISELGTVSSTIDLVQSTVTWTLGPNRELLTLTGAAAINGTGNDLANLIAGNAAANLLNASTGNDALGGGAGNDSLLDGTGNGSLTGGAGAGNFRLTTALTGATNVDRITDLNAIDDRFLLDDAVFSGIGPVGRIASANFRLGAAASDASDRVIYNPAPGQLFRPGSGRGLPPEPGGRRRRRDSVRSIEFARSDDQRSIHGCLCRVPAA
jgi:serralysin